MTWQAWLFLSFAITLGVAGLAALGFLVESQWLRQRSGARVTVHTTEDKSIEGVLRHTGRDGIVLSAAKWLEPATDLGGDVWVPREKVLFLQVP